MGEEPKAAFSPDSSTTSISELDSVEFYSPDRILDPAFIQRPFEYVNTASSKGHREAFADALNVWLGIPKERLEHVKRIMNFLHVASLMLDDIQDGSALRRGRPAAHRVFGEGQTMNSAFFYIMRAVEEAAAFNGADGTAIVIDEVKGGFIGQSHEIHWTRHNLCPSEEDYFKMVSGKTGVLFRVLTRLMTMGKHENATTKNIEELVTLLGKYYQIRDDYQNLYSDEYGQAKGFCEDLDEGKFSFPLMHYMNSKPHAYQLHELLRQRMDLGAMTSASKDHILDLFENSGSLEYTHQVLGMLYEQIEDCIGRVESDVNGHNRPMRSFLHALYV